MEDHSHGCLPFSTVEDPLLRHTWFVTVDRRYCHIKLKMPFSIVHHDSNSHEFTFGNWSNLE